MKIGTGDLVWVEMKLTGRLMGQVIKLGMDGVFVQPFDHPRMVIAQLQDLELVEAA